MPSAEHFLFSNNSRGTLDFLFWFPMAGVIGVTAESRGNGQREQFLGCCRRHRVRRWRRRCAYFCSHIAAPGIMFDAS